MVARRRTGLPAGGAGLPAGGGSACGGMVNGSWLMGTEAGFRCQVSGVRKEHTPRAPPTKIPSLEGWLARRSEYMSVPTSPFPDT